MHLGLVPSRNKHAKLSPHELVVLIWNRPRNVCQKVKVCRKLSWWNPRRGAKLRRPKTYHQDGNHATRKAKALVPPQDEVTSLLRQKTKQKPYAMAMRARAALVQRARRNDSLVPLLCVLCPALFAVRCALCCHVHRSVRCHLFLFPDRQ